jgi:hypothetical protein
VLLRLGRHDDYFGGDGGGDDEWWGVPEEDRPAMAELVLASMAVECSRLQSLGERLTYPVDDPRVLAVADEVHRRAADHVAAGGSLAELRSRLDELRRATFRWARPLPPGPDDEDEPDSIPAREGGTPDEPPTDPDWVIAGLFDAT